MEKTISAD